MAQERRPDGAAVMPIPAAVREDVEDVSWALSTAEAMWSRGDRGDALKWLRRAAEAASEAEVDDRALELAKAAADLAGLIERSSAVPPPPPSMGSRSAPPRSVPPDSGRRSPPPLPPASSRLGPAAPAPASQSSPSSTSTAPRTSGPSRASPKHPLSAAMHPSQMPAAVRSGGPVASTLVSRGSEGKRPRRSASHSDGETRPGVPPVRPRTASSSDTRRRKSSRPPPPTEVNPATQPEPDRTGAEEIDSWPTQSITSDALGGYNEDQTHIGPPPVEAVEVTESARPAPILAESEQPLQMSQAVRVVVWRGPDGVHIAPAGTRVAAITVEALLVAVDPAADLAAWLKGR